MKKNNKYGTRALSPNSVRAIFCGLNGCGKINVILSLTRHPNRAPLENVYVYSNLCFNKNLSI